jgi:dinuclear metal center YbgI/SA1388 family protein
MPQASLTRIVRHCDRHLRVAAIKDYDGAVNGLQVENRGSVSRVAAAVDASLATVRKACEARVDLMIVHHGLFWNARQPWTGSNYALLRLLLDNNVAVYSSHLPLDAHPVLGNNARLCVALGFRNLKPFFVSHGIPLGYQTVTRLSRDDLALRVSKVVAGRVEVIPGGPKICRRIGVVTGGAGADLKKAAMEGVDTFITGEGPHWSFAMAEELGINVLYAGHYATETFGVKALADHLSKKFRVPWIFLDHPTGL